MVYGGDGVWGISWVSLDLELGQGQGLYRLEQRRGSASRGCSFKARHSPACLLEPLVISNMCWLHGPGSGSSSPAGGEITACGSGRPSLTSLVCAFEHSSLDSCVRRFLRENPSFPSHHAAEAPGEGRCSRPKH